MRIDLLSIQPFEICSIRPPTENYSLTFRLTRNCYWNKCAFCPVYKTGARFSKRNTEEVKEDIQRARLIDDVMFEHGIGSFIYSDSEYAKVGELLGKIDRARWEAGIIEDNEEEVDTGDLDPRAAWFLQWFKDKPSLKDSFNHVLSWRIGGARTCFLGDADSLILKPAFLKEIIDNIRLHFPTVDRFTIYGRTSTAAKMRTIEELKSFKSAGLHRVHFGLESGSDKVLNFISKGVSKEEHIEGALKTKEAGLSCSVYVMPGLGGSKFSDEHVYETADVLTKISPDYIRLRTLQVFPATPLEEALHSGEFAEADEEQVVREIRAMVENIDAQTEIISDSATNLLNIQGKLPDDREVMLDEIDRYLALSRREKLLFSLDARLQSFVGQYGNLSEDIYKLVKPYIKERRLDFTMAPDNEIRDAIYLIRSKLMP